MLKYVYLNQSINLQMHIYLMHTTVVRYNSHMKNQQATKTINPITLRAVQKLQFKNVVAGDIGIYLCHFLLLYCLNISHINPL